jgi:hypothetical protein
MAGPTGARDGGARKVKIRGSMRSVDSSETVIVVVAGRLLHEDKIGYMYVYCCSTREEVVLPETIRAQTRHACPDFLAARLTYVFQSSRSFVLKTASLRLFNTISLRSIYDGSKSQSDASLNSARMPAFWPNDKPDSDGEVYAHPESDLQIPVEKSTVSLSYAGRFLLARQSECECCGTCGTFVAAYPMAFRYVLPENTSYHEV